MTPKFPTCQKGSSSVHGHFNDREGMASTSFVDIDFFCFVVVLGDPSHLPTCLSFLLSSVLCTSGLIGEPLART